MRRFLWILGGLLVVALLVSAGMVGWRLLHPATLAGIAPGVPMITSNGKSAAIVPAAELPATATDATGILLYRDDNTLALGTGEIQIRGNPADGTLSSHYSGPEVEVVVTQRTVIYRDTTRYDLDTVQDGKLYQTVGPGSVDEISKQSLVQVWGEKQDGRVLAEVLVYHNIGQ